MTPVRDRIQGLCRVPAGRLEPHPQRWRVHQQRQRRALEAMLREIGYADALLARELPDGRLQLIDGHLRAETTPDQQVPVLVVELSDDEALQLLATLDPLCQLGEADSAKVRELTEALLGRSPAASDLLRELADSPTPRDFPRQKRDVELKRTFQVLVECADESQQRQVFERLKAEGLRCRLLSL